MTQALRNLEQDGIIDRTVFATRPPSVVYALTPLGRTMLAPLALIIDWAEKNHDAIRTSRINYADRNDALAKQAA